MLTEDLSPMRDGWGHAIDDDPRCEWCQRSIVMRFGGTPNYECDACRDEFKRYVDAYGGMIEMVEQ